MKKNIPLIAGILTLVVAVLLGAWWAFGPEDLAQKITHKVEDGTGTWLDLSELETRQPWDKLCVIGPYATEDAAAGIVGMKKLSLGGSIITKSDSVTALVFVNGQNVAYLVDVPRATADFVKLSGQCFEKQHALFIKDALEEGPVYVHGK